MLLVDVIEVTPHSPAPGELVGSFIDAPRAGDVRDSLAVDFVGWVLGENEPAIAVEIETGGIVRTRLPIDRVRPDVAKAFPQAPSNQPCGFQSRISLTNWPDWNMQLRGVLRSGATVPIGSIRAKRRWHVDPWGADLVSIIIPCYGQSHFLTDAIESVHRQTYPHVEIVVVDDSSPDNTAAIVRRFPNVRYIRQPNAGLAAARNAGIRNTNGAFLVFLDADDRLLPEALQLGLDQFKAHPEAAFVCGGGNVITVDGTFQKPGECVQVNGDVYAKLLQQNFVLCPGAVMFRRSAIESCGVFDEANSPAADYAMYLRIARDHPVIFHDAIVGEYRMHGSNMTGNVATMFRSVMEVMRRERPFAKARQHQTAFQRGLSYWQNAYGEQLDHQARQWIRERDFRRALAALPLLARHYPKSLPGQFRAWLTGGGR